MTSLPATRGGRYGPDSLVARVASRVDGLHPFAATVVLVLAAYAALTAVILPVGLVLGSSVLASVDRWDESVNRWFVDGRTPVKDGLSALGSGVADTLTVVLLASAVVTWLAVTHRWKGALVLAVALSLEVTVFVTTSFVVDRDRPDVPRLDDAPFTSSFPSGHTAASVALYVGLALMASGVLRRAAARVAVLLLAGLVPVAVGVARLYRGMHHPTDVFFGVVLGAACLVAALFIVNAVAFVHRRRQEEGGEVPA